MMRYAAIDIETTGLNPETCQVLEIGCVVETDWRTPVEHLPAFRRLVNPGGVIRGEPRGLAMNARLLEMMATAPGCNLDENLIDLYGFLRQRFGDEKVTIAGKNFGSFDYRFLSRSNNWQLIRHRHRFIDPAMLWWHPHADDRLPDLGECRRRAGLPPRTAHDAVSDCLSVIELVRAYYARPVEVSVVLADDDLDATDEHTALRPELGEAGA